ncbi:hypothetical protein CSB37_00695 [bacterium DOLZORAL124_38_8]|nr:MAG: hypothetical protein CSB37_00695 [bacterium DOLZORAL124_38_8]
MKNTNTHTKTGFTMVELIIVMLLIGILATIGIYNYQIQIQKAHDTRKKVTTNEIYKTLAGESDDISNWQTIDSTAKIYPILNSVGIDTTTTKNEYYYFATPQSFGIATCLSDQTIFSKGTINPDFNCNTNINGLAF